MHSDKASMAAAPSEHIQVDRIGSEEPAQCCIASSKQLNFALSLSSFAKSVASMPCLLENKSAMHSALRHLFLLLPLSIGVSLIHGLDGRFLFSLGTLREPSAYHTYKKYFFVIWSNGKKK
jgi:hypothetical protein